MSEAKQIVITPEQRAMVRHAIGFDGRAKSTYRNHYVIGPGCDGYEAWLDLWARGLAQRRGPSELSGGDDTFFVSRALALFVREPDEHLSRDFREYNPTSGYLEARS